MCICIHYCYTFIRWHFNYYSAREGSRVLRSVCLSVCLVCLSVSEMCGHGPKICGRGHFGVRVRRFWVRVRRNQSTSVRVRICLWMGWGARMVNVPSTDRWWSRDSMADHVVGVRRTQTCCDVDGRSLCYVLLPVYFCMYSVNSHHTSRACERSGSGRISAHRSNLFLWLPIPAPFPAPPPLAPAPLPLQATFFLTRSPLRSRSPDFWPAPLQFRSCSNIYFKQQTENVEGFLPREQLC